MASNIIVVDPAPDGSDYIKFKVYRATTRTGTYTSIATQALTNLTYQDDNGTTTSWYKVSYIDDGDTKASSLSDPFQAMSTNYTTVVAVERYLLLPTLTDSTALKIQDVINLINRVEDQLDYRTGHAWRLRYSGTQSGDDHVARYEYYDADMNYEYQTGVPIRLKHRHVRTLDADEGDALEIWDGSSWINYITTRTEDRAEDFWFDYDAGVLQIKQRYALRKSRGVRIKYRYGEEVVNKMLEDIATKMVAIELIINGRRNVMLPEGSTEFSSREQVEHLRREVEERLTLLKEFQVPNLWL